MMFPAPAGMSPTGAGTVWLRYDVPRTRGDEPDTADSKKLILICSPHPRG